MRVLDAQFGDVRDGPGLARRLLAIIEADGGTWIEDGIVRWMVDTQVPLRALISELDLVALLELAAVATPLPTTQEGPA